MPPKSLNQLRREASQRKNHMRSATCALGPKPARSAATQSGSLTQRLRAAVAQLPQPRARPAAAATALSSADPKADSEDVPMLDICSSSSSDSESESSSPPHRVLAASADINIIRVSNKRNRVCY